MPICKFPVAFTLQKIEHKYQGKKTQAAFLKTVLCSNKTGIAVDEDITQIKTKNYSFNKQMPFSHFLKQNFLYHTFWSQIHFF